MSIIWVLQEKVKSIPTTVSFPFQSCVDYLRTFRTFFLKKNLWQLWKGEQNGSHLFLLQMTPNTDRAI